LKSVALNIPLLFSHCFDRIIKWHDHQVRVLQSDSETVAIV
jgi:hypothetical protein